eukprot:6698224-Prymnesium_polylepis.1
MTCIQDPALAPAMLAPALRAKYVAANRDLREKGLIAKTVELDATDPGELAASVQAVAASVIQRKVKKGTDVRWEHECKVLDEKVVDCAHLLAHAILILYGVGSTFDALAIPPGQKTATKTHEILSQPTFIFYATLLRLEYTLVYKSAFKEVQRDHHHCTPLIAGPNGLWAQWRRTFEMAVSESKVRGVAKRSLDSTLCAPVLRVLDRFPELGGPTGEHAQAAIQELTAQLDVIDRYFSKWGELQMLPHALCRECPGRYGPMNQAEAQEADEAVANGSLPCWSDSHFYLRFPHPHALECARLGIELFEKAMPFDRAELQGTLVWNLFSPKTRTGEHNP